MVIHLTARAYPGRKPLLSREACSWFWKHFRESFPRSLAACLMPDHVHNLTPTRDPSRERNRLSHLLGALTRYYAPESRWIVAESREIPDTQQLLRQVRYVHLNPVRARIVDDPMSYAWSTHRGLIGAEIDPWLTSERLAEVLRRSAEGFAQWMHAYISGDPSVHPNGSPFPVAAPAQLVPVVPLSRIVTAAWSATPWSNLPTKRRVVAQLARHQGWTNDALVAQALSITPQALARSAKKAAPEHLAAAALCLGDERLLVEDFVFNRADAAE